MDFVELLGYVASFLIAFSLVTASIVRLRVINLIGAIIFASYGALISALPVVLTNSIIVVINIVHLSRLMAGGLTTFRYQVLDLGSADSQAGLFLAEHDSDIKKFYPLFSSLFFEKVPADKQFFYAGFKGPSMFGFALLVDAKLLVPSESGQAAPNAGLLAALAAEKQDHATQLLEMFGSVHPADLEQAYFMPADYLIPRYRDLGIIGRFHKRLLEEPGLRGHRIFTTVNRSDVASVSYFTRNGYAKIRKRGDLVLLELELSELELGAF